MRILLAAAVLIAGCDPAKPQRPSYDSLKQPLAVGQEFQIVLSANPTTGYHWTMQTPPDPKVLQDLGSEYEGSPNPGKMVGMGGWRTWAFKAVGPGETTFTLRYSRGGPPDPGDEIKPFKVAVK